LKQSKTPPNKEGSHISRDLLRNKLPILEKLISLALPRRSKYPLSVKLRAISFFLFSQASIRAVAALCDIPHNTLLYWIKQLALFFSRIPTLKKADVIGIDETKIRWKRKGRHLYVWIVLDLKTKEVLEVEVTKRRDSEVAMKLVLENGLSSREIVTDRGPWYNWLDLWEYGCHRKERFGRRSLVERAIRWLKERLSGSLMFRSGDIEYIRGVIKLIHFLKLSQLSCLI